MSGNDTVPTEESEETSDNVVGSSSDGSEPPNGETSRDGRLVRAGRRIVATDGAVGRSDVEALVGALESGLEEGTHLLEAKALFVAAEGYPGTVAGATDALETLAGASDPVVQGWAVAALGRVAAERPDAVAPAAEALRNALDYDATVQHNAVEALATLAQSHPDAVTPAVPDLRSLCTHDEVAVQHNAAAALGVIAGARPDAVVPAVADLKPLCDHDEPAVRRVATSALVRLARERPGSVQSG